jgi:hypothetical protein
MQLLPSELNHLIVKLSSGSLNSLAVLARTHSAFQKEAEKALYDTLYIYASSDDSMKCMETLARNSEKAGLVRFLTIEYASDNTKKNRRVTTYLSKSLINMHCLSDFRVRSCIGGIEAQSIKGLGKILWLVCKIFDHLKTNDSESAGDTVKVISDYELCTASTVSRYLKSLRVKLNCRYLDYIPLLGVQETS